MVVLKVSAGCWRGGVENVAQVNSKVAWITPETATVLARAGNFIGGARYCAALAQPGRRL